MKPSSKTYRLSGALGCLPSLLLFIAVLGSDFHYGLSNAMSFALLSLVLGLAGVIGLFSAARMRRQENKDAEAHKKTDE